MKRYSSQARSFWALSEKLMLCYVSSFHFPHHTPLKYPYMNIEKKTRPSLLILHSKYMTSHSKYWHICDGTWEYGSCRGSSSTLDKVAQSSHLWAKGASMSSESPYPSSASEWTNFSYLSITNNGKLRANSFGDTFSLSSNSSQLHYSFFNFLFRLLLNSAEPSNTMNMCTTHSHIDVCFAYVMSPDLLSATATSSPHRETCKNSSRHRILFLHCSQDFLRVEKRKIISWLEDCHTFCWCFFCEKICFAITHYLVESLSPRISATCSNIRRDRVL